VKKLGFKGAMIHAISKAASSTTRNTGPFGNVRWRSMCRSTSTRAAVARRDAGVFDGYEDIAGAAWGFAVDTSIHFLRICLQGCLMHIPS